MMSRYIVLILRMTAYCYHYLVCLQRMGYFGEVTRSSALQLDEAGLEVGELLYCTVLYCTVLYCTGGGGAAVPLPARPGRELARGGGAAAAGAGLPGHYRLSL